MREIEDQIALFGEEQNGVSVVAHDVQLAVHQAGHIGSQSNRKARRDSDLQLAKQRTHIRHRANLFLNCGAHFLAN